MGGIGLVYIYDGLFDGFLTCIYEHYYTMKVTGICAEERFQQLLFEESKKIETCPEKANKVRQALISKLSEPVYQDIYYTFLSNDPNKDDYLLEYIILGFKMGPKIFLLHSQGIANKIKKLSRKVGFERHRFLGLLRFMDAGDFLYALFEPDHDIIMSLAAHFADRLGNERFIIHDQKRKKAIICNHGQYGLVDFDMKIETRNNEKEMYFQELWRTYFNTVSIEFRKNLKLQQGFVPLKYRKNILEFNQGHEVVAEPVVEAIEENKKFWT